MLGRPYKPDPPTCLSGPGHKHIRSPELGVGNLPRLELLIGFDHERRPRLGPQKGIQIYVLDVNHNSVSQVL